MHWSRAALNSKRSPAGASQAEWSVSALLAADAVVAYIKKTIPGQWTRRQRRRRRFARRTTVSQDTQSINSAPILMCRIVIQYILVVSFWSRWPTSINCSVRLWLSAAPLMACSLQCILIPLRFNCLQYLFITERIETTVHLSTFRRRRCLPPSSCLADWLARRLLHPHQVVVVVVCLRGWPFEFRMSWCDSHCPVCISCWFVRHPELIHVERENWGNIRRAVALCVVQMRSICPPRNTWMANDWPSTQQRRAVPWSDPIRCATIPYPFVVTAIGTKERSRWMLSIINIPSDHLLSILLCTFDTGSLSCQSASQSVLSVLAIVVGRIRFRMGRTCLWDIGCWPLHNKVVGRLSALQKIIFGWMNLLNECQLF